MVDVLVIGLILAFLVGVILLEAGDVIFASPEARKAARRAAKLPVLIVPATKGGPKSSVQQRIDQDVPIPLVVTREPPSGSDAHSAPDHSYSDHFPDALRHG